MTHAEEIDMVSEFLIVAVKYIAKITILFILYILIFHCESLKTVLYLCYTIIKTKVPFVTSLSLYIYVDIVNLYTYVSFFKMLSMFIYIPTI